MVGHLRRAGRGSAVEPPAGVEALRGLSNQPWWHRQVSRLESERWECLFVIPHPHRVLLWARTAIFARRRPIGQLWRIVSAARGTWHSLPSVACVLSQLQSRLTPTSLSPLHGHDSVMTPLPQRHPHNLQVAPPGPAQPPQLSVTTTAMCQNNLHHRRLCFP